MILYVVFVWWIYFAWQLIWNFQDVLYFVFISIILTMLLLAWSKCSGSFSWKCKFSCLVFVWRLVVASLISWCAHNTEQGFLHQWCHTKVKSNYLNFKSLKSNICENKISNNILYISFIRWIAKGKKVL